MGDDINLLAALGNVVGITIDPDAPVAWSREHEASLEGPSAWMLDDDGRPIGRLRRRAA